MCIQSNEEYRGLLAAAKEIAGMSRADLRPLGSHPAGRRGHLHGEHAFAMLCVCLGALLPSSMSEAIGNHR